MSKESQLKRWLSSGGLTLPDGKPQRFYHGTIRDFTEFAPHSGFGRIRSRSKGGNDPRTWGIDCHAFTSCPEVAATYAFGKKSRKAADALVMPVYLRAENPIRFDAKGAIWHEFHDAIVQLARRYCGKDFEDVCSPSGHVFYDVCKELIADKERLTDAVILDNVIDVYEGDEKPSTTVFVFEARNIKSALGNCGLYGEDTYNITR